MPIPQLIARSLFPATLVLAALVACGADVAIDLPAPAQDQGLPYTRSAQARAVAVIRTAIAIYPGSRYAWVQGRRVRLDDARWRDEAQERDGVLYVPEV